MPRRTYLYGMKWLLIVLIIGSLSVPGFAQEEKISIWFETASWAIPDSALWPLVKKIHQPGLERILIEGHCDSIGSVPYNVQLSNKRALAVKQFLLTNGLRDNQIKTCIGWGKSKPIASNQLDETRQLNRRVDVIVYRNTSPSRNTVITKQQTRDSIHRIDTIHVGKSIRLQHLYFEPGRHKIKEASMPELIRLLRTMVYYPKLRIEIQGHVCCSEVDEDGFDWDTETNNLSVNRAQAVAGFLIEQGISPKRLVVKGYGGSQKIALDERNEENKALNRRVECKILSK